MPVPAAVSHLTAENLVLVVNKNDPASGKLAQFYADQRKVPAGRIISLDLPAGDEIPFDDFNAKAVAPIRAFLKDHQLETKVTCIVTFYGVPLRVGPRSNGPAESAEYRQLDAQFKQILERVHKTLASLEEQATEVSPEFKPAAGGSKEFTLLPYRAASAINTLLQKLPADTDANRRDQRFTRLMAGVETLYGPLEAIGRLTQQPYQSLNAKAPGAQEVAAAEAKLSAAVKQIGALGPRAGEDAEVRTQIRAIFAECLGDFRTLQVVAEQRARLETAETEASFDSELACLWWPDSRTRYRWHDNPLNYHLRFAAELRAPATAPANPLAAPATLPAFPVLPHTLMAMRIDAPTEPLAYLLITRSIEVEKAGLKGVAAIDARGRPPSDPYGKFDEALRDLAKQLRFSTRMNVVLDDNERVFAPGSVKDTAIYCGWYSLRNYVPGMVFTSGAVGYHIASGELANLHNPMEKGWVHGLMSDGVVATLGPVAEPYLHAFPQPNEFFPLLLTGKLKLAEVYWLTNPLVSWMNTCIGDPLYVPYQQTPAMKEESLPQGLRVIFTSGQRGKADRLTNVP